MESFILYFLLLLKIATSKLIQSNNNINIINITDSSEIQFNIRQSQPFYFIALVNKPTINIFVQNNDNAIIYLKNYDRNGYNEIIKDIEDDKNKIRYDSSTANEIVKNYMKYEFNKMDSYYVLIKILSNINMKLNLVHDIFSDDSSDNKFIYLNSEDTIEKYNLLKIDMVKGDEKAIINIFENGNKYTYILEYGLKENLKIYLDPEKKYEIKIESSNNFTLHYRKIKIESNLNKINFRKNNYIYFLDQTINSINCFMDLSGINLDNDIHLNFKFIENDDNGIIIDNLNFNSYIVNDKFLEDEEDENSFKQLIKTDFYYQKEINSGYTLLPINDINSIINEKNEELFIYIEIKNNEEFNCIFSLMMTLTDFNDEYDLPMNEYLFINVKEKLNLTFIPKYKNSFIEMSYDNNKIDFDTKGYNYINQYGKTFLFLEKDENYKLYFNNKNSKGDLEDNKYFNNNDNNIIKPNLVIKYSYNIYGSNNAYFYLKDENINYNYKTKYLSFYPVQRINSQTASSSITIQYKIRIYDIENNLNFKHENILEEEKPIYSKDILDNESEEEIKISLEEFSNEKTGNFDISILAEAKINDENIHEYILYKYKNILLYNEEIIDITINEKKMSKDIRSVKSIFIKANLNLVKEDELEYFIKLSLDHKNNEIKENEIYVSTDEDFFNKDEKILYDVSQFKTIERSTSLSIPINDLNNFENSTLYIRIPCRNNCDIYFNYVIENSRHLRIYENKCYDVTLNKNYEDTKKLYKLYYESEFEKHNDDEEGEDNFYYIVITSYTSNNYKVEMSNGYNDFLHNNFHNGYSYSINTQQTYEFLSFFLYINEKMTLKVCGYNASSDRKIKLGEVIYSYGEYGDFFSLEDYDEIEKNYDYLIINYLSYSKNIVLSFDPNDEDINIYDDESNNIHHKKFQNLGIKSDILEVVEDYYTPMSFQILGVKNNIITQSLNRPLTNGLSTQQTLKEGQILYYRLYQYTENSKYLRVHLKKRKGNIELYESICTSEKWPNCSFTVEDLQNLTEIKNTFENNIYYERELTEKEKQENVYQKLEYAVFIVYCNTSKNNINSDSIIDIDDTDTDCNYFIEMSNEKDNLIMNEGSKMYSYFDKPYYEGEERRVITLTGSIRPFLFGEDYVSDASASFNIELYSYSGELSYLGIDKGKASLSSASPNETFQNKSLIITYTINSFDKYAQIVNIQISVSLNSSFYAVYYLLNNKKNDNFTLKPIDLSEGMMHFNKIRPKETYSYSFYNYEMKIKDYIVSASCLNCYFIEPNNTNNDKENKRYIQTKKNNSEFFNVSCELESASSNYQCEFITSYEEIKDNSLTKNIQFNGFYQFYQFNDEIKSINLKYNITEEDIESGIIYINVNKHSLEKLNIEYKLNNNAPTRKIIYKYQDFFLIDLSSFKTSNKNNEFTITITPSNDNNMNLNFTIKTNINNNRAYLPADSVEYGYIKNNMKVSYYFDNEYNDNFPQEIYLHSTGIAKFKMSYSSKKIQDGKDNNPIVFYDEGERLNHYYFFLFDKIKSSSRIYMDIYLDKSNDNDNMLFTIYRHYQQKKSALIVPLNTNIYGYIYADFLQNFHFKTDISNLKENLVINFNCKKCFMCIYESYESNNCAYNFTSSQLFPKKNISNISDQYIYYSITGERSGYYLSYSDSKNSKSIEQYETQRCFGFCKLVMPLHSYYYFNNSQIILFAPGDNTVKIYYDFEDLDELENGPYIEVNLDDNDNYLRNYMVINLDTAQIKEKGKNLKIYAVSHSNSSFDFVTNIFYDSYINDNDKYMKDFIIINNTKFEEYLPFNITNNSYYKFEFYLLDGNGIISLDDSEKYKFYLNHEYHDNIYLYIKLPQYNLTAKNLDNDNNFTFYSKICDLNKYNIIEDKIDSPNAYKFIYYGDNDNNEIFPLNYKIATKNGKNLIINYRFIELERNGSNENVFNTSEESFIATLNVENSGLDLINIDNIYYNEFRRGYISINISDNYDDDYINITIDKNISNYFTYKKVIIEIISIRKSIKGQGEGEEILIPKNAYIQFDFVKNKNLIFSNSIPGYNTIIEIANSSEMNITNIEDYDLKKENGKSVLYPKDNNKEIKNINITTNNNNNLLIKYLSKKEECVYFNLSNNTIYEKKIFEDNNTFILSHKNIKLNNNINSPGEYKITYFIRLYDYLAFFTDDEINNIMIKIKPYMSFRKELNQTELTYDIIDYTVSFGDIEKKQYYISVIGEVSYNDTVEYFAFENVNFRIPQTRQIDYDETFTVTLIIFILIMVAIIAYITLKIIFKIKNKKKNNNDGKEDKGKLLVNMENNNNDADANLIKSDDNKIIDGAKENKGDKEVKKDEESDEDDDDDEEE